MANKRMFTKQITESDAFLDMPATSQNLYFHLNMNADDDGFVNAPNRIIKTVGANKNDMDILISKKFVLIFENGIIVIKHWRIHNTLRTDRYKETVYKDEKANLAIDESGNYTIQNEPTKIAWQPSGNQMDTNGCQLGTTVESSIDKNRLDKNRVVVVNNTEEPEETAAETTAATRETLKEIIKVYEAEIGLITPTVAEKIEAFLEELPADIITRAIKEASMHNVKAWKYIASILNRCVHQGIKNSADFENKKNKNGTYKPIKVETGKYDGLYKN